MFGLPISPEYQEDGIVVQYFEAAEFQWMPGLAPETNDVLLALLGSRAFGAPDPAVKPGADSEFAELTGHNIREPFLTAYHDLGGLDRFGYPLNEPVTGPDAITVQYFQRGRLEKPAWSDAVYPGAIGREAYANRQAQTPTPTPTGSGGAVPTASTVPTATTTPTVTEAGSATITVTSAGTDAATPTPGDILANTSTVTSREKVEARNGGRKLMSDVIKAIKAALGLTHKSER